MVTLEGNILGNAYVEYLKTPSIDRAKEVQQVTYELSWVDPLSSISPREFFPRPPRGEAPKIESSPICAIDGQLYEKSFSYLLLKCLRHVETNYVLREIPKAYVGIT